MMFRGSTSHLFRGPLLEFLNTTRIVYIRKPSSRHVQQLDSKAASATSQQHRLTAQMHSSLPGGWGSGLLNQQITSEKGFKIRLKFKA
jgi:hypothetical protein